jgi:site-specific recombinase XerD
VFEKVPGSGVWWIQYFGADGRRRREKIGSKSSATQTVESRRTKVREGVKMPVNIRAKKITFAEIAESALAWSRANKRSSDYDVWRMPKLVAEFGARQAEAIEPSEITEWLESQSEWTLATRNRYLALMKLTYRLAETRGKLKINPTRLVRQRKENNERVRYLSDAEEIKLRAVME